MGLLLRLSVLRQVRALVLNAPFFVRRMEFLNHCEEEPQKIAGAPSKLP